MSKTKNCGHCHYAVPSGAKVCAHCGAQFIKWHDGSFGARIGAAFRGVILGGILGGAAGYFANDASEWAIIGACILAVLGFLIGNSGESTRR